MISHGIFQRAHIYEKLRQFYKGISYSWQRKHCFRVVEQNLTSCIAIYKWNELYKSLLSFKKDLFWKSLGTFGVNRVNTILDRGIFL